MRIPLALRHSGILNGHDGCFLTLVLPSLGWPLGHAMVFQNIAGTAWKTRWLGSKNKGPIVTYPESKATVATANLIYHVSVLGFIMIYHSITVTCWRATILGYCEWFGPNILLQAPTFFKHSLFNILQEHQGLNSSTIIQPTAPWHFPVARSWPGSRRLPKTTAVPTHPEPKRSFDRHLEEVGMTHDILAFFWVLPAGFAG